jgi:predicted O-linked N-acetylglucosamine transferase (SPINDLY family)
MGDLAGAREVLIREAQAGANPDVLSDLAALCLELNDFDTASAVLERVLALPRPPVQAHVNAGILARRRRDEAAAERHFRAAIKRDPSHAATRVHLATQLLELGRLDEAATAIALTLKQRPNDPGALSMLGYVRFQQKRFGEALDAYRRAERGGADVTTPMSQLAMAFAHVCDWQHRAEMRRRLETAVARLANLADPAARRAAGTVDCFAVIAHADDPAFQRAATATVAAQIRARVGPAPRRPARAPAADGRLHIAYLSADFHQHATAELLVGVLEQHDRTRFHVSAYSYGIDQDTDLRARTRGAFDRFVELGLEPPAASADRIAADGVDILIDLKGYTDSARPEITALRAAPIQVSWLGFPATMGADWMDAVIADPHVLPMSEQPNWSERIVHLPGSYQCNDDQRVRPEPDRDRAAHGLPADGIVFACFNNNYKLTPERFATWLELLAAVPSSCLWLLEMNPFAASNLRATARVARIDPARLVFAPVLELAPHLARHGCADIFLDTEPYGAHTTASNALWMGLPVVTRPGRCFASRVGASLLHAAGVPELIATDEAAYKALALELARDRAERERLGTKAASSALFDTKAFTRGFEAALEDLARPGALPLDPAKG